MAILKRQSSYFCFLTLALLATQVHMGSAKFDWRALLGVITDGIHESGSTQFLDLDCNYSVTPTLRHFELFYRARFWCPGLIPSITGTALGRSSPGTVFDATKDFAQKSLERKLYTREQLKHWL